ncbi:DUF1330 domain-containing protein [Pontivivens insulae]|uniref:DUF1330 domain-containing protein n=1 Tax=Pontivivens insulae TaxID=1639689 RepID=A0A2R8AC41_9RHOB|nr:DUF1330 domain-containing protein [Pontivivens insulae]RED11217.1 uncharacterized protein (DUF1330 family) [Pontivivens insulae]SPF29610.1 hypothetical protein POI8812_01923 [Pontivivens insulae]
MSAYIIARIEVTNPEAYMKYASQTVALAEKFGGTFLVKAGPMKQLEGDGPERHVVIQFPDMERAERFYASDEYAQILPIALNASKRDLVLVEGV